jgi:hypothetical protein
MNGRRAHAVSSGDLALLAIGLAQRGKLGQPRRLQRKCCIQGGVERDNVW